MAPTLERHSKPNHQNPKNKTRRPRLTVKQILYHPLTWLAVGAHIGLLFVPFNPSAPSAAEPDVPEEDIDESVPVDILNLADISTPTPPAESTPPPVTPPAAPPPAVPAAAPVAAPEPSPVAEPTAIPEAAPVTPQSDPVTSPTEPAPPAYDPSGDQQVFVGHINAIGIDNYRDTLGLPGPNTFPKGNGASFLDFANPVAPVPIAGARDAVWMDKQPLDVLEKLKQTYEPAGVTFSQMDSYGGELLYELTNPDGQPFMHVSLVDFATGSSLLVMWSASPL